MLSIPTTLWPTRPGLLIEYAGVKGTYVCRSCMYILQAATPFLSQFLLPGASLSGTLLRAVHRYKCAYERQIKGSMYKRSHLFPLRW